jgi:hypothetical protein
VGARSGATLAWRLRMALVEHAALCRLVAGGKAHALHEIARAAHLLTVAPTREYATTPCATNDASAYIYGSSS